MSESKFLQKKKKHLDISQDFSWKKVIYPFFNKVLLCVLLFVSCLIAFRIKPTYREIVKEKVFEKNFSFASINNWYQEHFGAILPFDQIGFQDHVSVFEEKLVYENASLYKDGVKLEVSSEYLVPVLKSGIVVFLGEKENYGTTVIIQQVDGVDVWYGNVSTTNIKLYDYVEKGSLLGTSINDSLYLVFQKEGKFLDYQDFIE